MSVLHDAIGNGHEAVVIDTAVGCQICHHTAVFTFRRFHQAHATDLRRMHIAHFVRGCVGVDATRTEGGDSSSVRQFGKWVLLVEVLNQGVAGEELAHGIDERARIDEIIGAADFIFFEQFEAGANRARHLCQRRTQPLGHHIADTAQVAVFQAVDIICLSRAERQKQNVFDSSKNIFSGQLRRALFQTQLIVEAATTERTE